jgi:hypothetical protein
VAKKAKDAKTIPRSALALAASLAIAAAAVADPPFVTDDPEPAPPGHFENLLYFEGTRAEGAWSGTGIGVKINYGAFEDMEINTTIPFEFEAVPSPGTSLSLGDVGLGITYRFIPEDEDGWRPQVSFSPEIEVPMRSSLGRNARLGFPLWAQKSFGAWTGFGGGGFWRNPGPDKLDYWLFGFALVRKIAPDFSIGAELFHQTPEEIGGKTTTGIGLGAFYDFSETLHLAGSLHTGIQNRHTTDEISYSVTLEWTPQGE